MTFPRTVSAAVQYLAKHPELHANPALLMAACQEWSDAMIRQIDFNSSLCPVTMDMVAEALHQAGIKAAQEVAMPCHKQVVISDNDLINPEDLR